MYALDHLTFQFFRLLLQDEQRFLLNLIYRNRMHVTVDRIPLKCSL
ncbi:Uncharacterised protein [Streptococcus pneumoniae]|nr:Uncharacterised protein [Streptococcus pneumoniae]CJB83328.1 Uncharacterised protein [Streptococcus pneumoniae]CJD66158.1 Uncharacterised protein [Streptococcus pneumoniae]CKD79701.1 Uncharacterised protein [Streptococcus pneumoniae]